MFSTSPIDRVARKQHRCTNCGEPIAPGETYKRWISFDDSAFTSKMHPECLVSLEEDCQYGKFEYMPYSGARPEAMDDSPAHSGGEGGIRTHVTA